MTKYIIIGGVAGGASTAARIRRIDEKAVVILYERGEHVSYANCGLPYHIGGIISERDRLFVMTPEKFRKSLNVDVRVNHEVLAIHPQKRLIQVKNLNTGKLESESYDRLLLSPGAEPIIPPITGIAQEGVFTLRSVPDMDRIQQYIHAHQPKKALVVGAGFIGLEMAENMHRLGMSVTIIERQNQVMPPLDFEMASLVWNHLQQKRLRVLLGETLVQVDKIDQGLLQAKLCSGESINTDIVVLSVGVRPDTKLAKDANLTLEKNGAIRVNSYLQTSDPDIYAVGDAIAFPSPLTNTPATIPLAGPASKQARIAAENMVQGNTRTYSGSFGTSIVKVFDLTAGVAGVNEKQLRDQGIPFQAAMMHSLNHAGYYPGAKPLSLKIVFAPDGKLLGAQCVGQEGVDKRLDVVSSILKRNGSISDMVEFEQAYAPPFSSSRDPINISGMVAENILKGLSAAVYWNEIDSLLQSGAFFIDVRTPEEFSLGTISSSVNIPHTEIRSRLGEIPGNRKIVVFCKVGQRGYLAERILRQNGFSDVCNLSGGITTWESAIRAEKNEILENNSALGLMDTSSDSLEPAFETEINACGLQCPGPILRLKKAIDSLPNGHKIRIQASDPGFARDVDSWCRLTGNVLTSLKERDNLIEAIIMKSTEQKNYPGKESAAPEKNASFKDKELTMVVFSNDLDKAMASFVIANGAASSGKKVTMFFTFWGLSILRKTPAFSNKKDWIGKAFGWMLPSNSNKLPLSKMNFAGMGPVMMKSRMRQKNIDSLDKMMQTAQELGVHLVACQMSMDVMGLSKDELLPGIEIGGVAHYLEKASHSGINLFI